MFNSILSRRGFLASSTVGLAGMSFISLANDQISNQVLSKNPTIQEIVNLIISVIPGGIKQNTVDTFKAGDPSKICTGIVSTFMATAEVIQKTVELGANFIITHEPTFYNHLDEVDWLKNDPVYNFKNELIERNNITIWRFHDYWHSVQPDGIFQGLVKLLGWEDFVLKENEIICQIPETSLRELGGFFKDKLYLKRPFIVGDPKMSCTRIALLPGAWGGKAQIDILSTQSFDVMVVGEVAEWETSEYIRDANFAGINRGLIILGHADSEEPGMQYLVEWLKPLIPDIAIFHVAAEDAFLPI